MRIAVAGTGRIGALHASTLTALEQVDEVVVTDVVADAARALADERGYRFEPDLATALDRADGLVIATSTDAHAATLRAAVRAGVPTFCEKPVARTLAETTELVDLVAASGVAVHVGFQRRFDDGYRRAREAVRSGELGVVQSAEARTLDHSPPPPGYLPTSGGLFRDCSIHDFDVLRFVTGREVVSAFAVGAVRGDERFAAAADIATGAALLTLDDDTLVTVTASRYNGGGHDVRLEVHGSLGTIGVGYDETLAVTSAEAGVDWPRGPRVTTFMERFRRAYRAELAAFTEVVAGKPSPCTVEDALAAFRVAEACERSRATGRPVAVAEIGAG